MRAIGLAAKPSFHSTKGGRTGDKARAGRATPFPDALKRPRLGTARRGSLVLVRCWITFLKALFYVITLGNRHAARVPLRSPLRRLCLPWGQRPAAVCS